MSACQGKSLYNMSVAQRKKYVNKNSYEFPNPFETEEQFNRFYGLDIENMTDFERWQEVKRLEFALAWLKKDKLFIDVNGNLYSRITWGLGRLKKLEAS